MGKAIAAIVGVFLLVVAGCSDPSPADEALSTAAACGNIKFRHRPQILSTSGETGWRGDALVALVAVIPSNEVSDFITMSGLPQLTPGIPDDWLIRGLWRKDWGDSLRTANRSATKSVHVTEHPQRWVAVEDRKDGTSRVFLYLTCF
ncbi:hypothetical protein NRB20_59170 [Nocardia sp. RB20]|uniref:Lipoprotein n=2 Tax=Nocardia macrotermitis TaxID=2585198 RepID=A0A7K0DAI0_9NOCA|nr:hypothetical protein [Nocardia macrotermitis]